MIIKNDIIVEDHRKCEKTVKKMRKNERVLPFTLKPEEKRPLVTDRDEYGLLFCLGDSCRAEWEDQCAFWGREEILLMQPGHRVVLEPRKPEMPPRMLWLCVTADRLRQLSDEETDLQAGFDFLPFGCAVIPAGAQTAMLARNLCNRLMREEKEPEYGSAVLQRGILEALLVLVLRAAIRADQQRVPCKRSQFMVGDVFVYIQEHLSEKLTLQSFENAFYVSHEHIAREFKRQTGQTLHQYILTMRIERACELLRQGLSASKVWPQCGFESASYFFQAFRRRCGMTPTEYAKKQQEAQLEEKERRENT